MKKNSNCGFTLVELVIVIVIIGILSMVAVPVYRSYVRRAMSAEGVAFAGSISTAERFYFARYGSYLPCTTVTSNCTALGLDASGNKYFKYFDIAGGATYGARLYGSGDAAGLRVEFANASETNPVQLTFVDNIP